MKNSLIILIISYFIISCASKKVVVNDELISASNQKETTKIEINPDDFAKNMPSSNIIRQSLIHYENTYSRVYSDDEVINAAGSSKMIAVIKPLEIGFTIPNCPGLVLDGSFANLWVSEYNAVIFGSSRVDFYSAFDCARYASYKKAFNTGPAITLGRYILEWSGSKVVIRDAYNSSIIFNGDVGGNVVTAGLVKGVIGVVLDNRYIMTFKDKIKAFSIEGTFPVDFAYIAYSDNTFYGILKSGEFFTVTDTETNVTNHKNCTLSHTSPYAMCNGILTNGKEEYKGLPMGDIFSVGVGLYLTINDTTLNIYSLTPSWQRFVALGYELPVGCTDKKGVLYYNGFSGLTYKVSKDNVNVVEQMPKGCNKKNVTLRDGKFYCGKKVCGIFSEIVNQDDKNKMYIRKEEGKVYFYFSK